MSKVIESIGWERIVPNPWNVRDWYPKDDQDSELVELARSMEAHCAEGERAGNFEAICVRPHGKQPGMFEIAFGESRWRAVRLSATAKKPVWREAGREPVTELHCVVREMTDGQLFDLMMHENAKRKNKSPLEEARTVAAYREVHGDWSLDQVAAQLGVSVRVAARRLQLAQLSPKWQEVLRGREHPVCGWSAAHLERIAALPDEVQDRVLEDIGPWMGSWSLDDLRRHLTAKFAVLDGAPWDLNDEGLLAGVGSCTGCTHRSGCQPLLWDEADFVAGHGEKPRAGERCLDAMCFKRKGEAHLQRALEEAKKEHKKVLLLVKGYGAYGTPWDGKVHHAGDFEIKGKPAPGLSPAMYVDPGSSGKLVYVQSKSGASNATKKAAGKGKILTLEEMRAELERARLQHASEVIAKEVNYWLKEDGKNLPEVPLRVLFAAFITFGHEGAWDYKDQRSDWEKFEEWRGKDEKALLRQLTRDVIENIGEAEFPARNFRDAAHVREACEGFCAAFGLDWDDIWKTACEAVKPGVELERAEAEARGDVEEATPFKKPGRLAKPVAHVAGPAASSTAKGKGKAGKAAKAAV